MYLFKFIRQNELLFLCILSMVILRTFCSADTMTVDEATRKAFEQFDANLFTIPENITMKDAGRMFFQHFESEDPIGIPILEIKDPVVLPAEVSDLIQLDDVKVYGQSQIRINHFHMDLFTLKGWVDSTIPWMEVSGNYTWPGFYYSSNGFMNLTLYNLILTSNFTMEVDEKSMLRLTDLQLKVEIEFMVAEFTGLLWEHQALVSSGTFDLLFDENLALTIDYYRPYIIEALNTKIQYIISKLPAVDFGFIKDHRTGRLTEASSLLMTQIFQYMKLDPLHLPDKKFTLIGVDFVVSDITLYGLSFIESINSLVVIYKDRKLFVDSWMKYPKLELYYNYRLKGTKLFDMIIMEKNRLNAVDMKISIVVDLSLRRPPHIRHFHIKPESYDKVSSRSNNFWGRVRYFFSNIGSTIRRQTVNTLAKVLRLILQGQLNNMDLKTEIMNVLSNSENENNSYPSLNSLHNDDF